jgi:predicted metal-dependent phosphoesterase TrpH
MELKMTIAPDERLGTRRTGKADLHIHSAAGDGIHTVAELLEHVEHHTDLDVIAITDHDEVGGALEAVELALRKRYRFEVIPGIEVSTRNGHLIGLFVNNRVPMLQSLEASVEAIHAQGGVCIVPHPLSWLTMSVGRRRLLRMHARRDDRLYLDGIETFNPTFAGRVVGSRAERLNRAILGLAETGGSDAHSSDLVGTGHTLFPGRTANDLRTAIEQRATWSGGRYWSTSDHLRGAATQQWRAMVVHPYRKVKRAVSGSNGQ